MANRGEYTPEVAKEMKDFLGRDAMPRELRLIPYVQYVMVNEQRLDPMKINQEERDVLRAWREAGHIVGGASGLAVTEDFWLFMCRILMIAYVDYADRTGEI